MQIRLALGTLGATGKDRVGQQVTKAAGTATATERKDVRPDVARVNLMHAFDLPHGVADEAEVERHLATLDAWTELCRVETRRAMKDFKKDPAYYDHSEATFRMMCVVTVVQRDLGMRYNPDAVGNFDFSDSRDCFIHGLLDDRRRGTCVNIPVLYVAIGRRLGYPIHLQLAKGHVLAKWHQEHGETVNIEGTNLGLTTQPDSYYRGFPREIYDDEATDYLRPLSPDEERGLFMGTRGHCLEDNGRFDEALACYERAAQLQPKPYFYAGHAERLSQLLGRHRPGACDTAGILNIRNFRASTPNFITAYPPVAPAPANPATSAPEGASS